MIKKTGGSYEMSKKFWEESLKENDKHEADLEKI